MFIAMMAGSLLGLLCAFVFIHRRMVKANSRIKSSMLTWSCLAITLLPNWFVSLVVGGNIGGAWGGNIAEAVGWKPETFVALGIFGGMAGYLFATTLLLAFICSTVASGFLPE